MIVGLYDIDSHNFPNLPLMKISAWHKLQGDFVEWYNPWQHYDKLYISKVFGDEYTKMSDTAITNADEIVYGGTGFAITIENGKEVYHKDQDKDLPYEIEHIYPDYSLYPKYTQNTAYGFLTRGCCNNCDFCIVSKKEGGCSVKVADLSEWWHGQKEIKLLDPNLLACKDRLELLKQLADSGAKVDFTQGLDARFISPQVLEILKNTKVKMYHFAFDFMKNEKAILKGLKLFKDNIKNIRGKEVCVYILTNYNTTFAEDLYRVKKIQELGLTPDVRIYRKETAPKFTRYLQAWCNNRFIYNGEPNFFNYKPLKSTEKTIQQLFPTETIECEKYWQEKCKLPLDK